MPILEVHSFVKVAECGLKITFLFFNKGLFISIGSFEKTSNAAPNINPSFYALSKSDSLIIPPLAVLTIIEFFFIVFNTE